MLHPNPIFFGSGLPPLHIVECSETADLGKLGPGVWLKTQKTEYFKENKKNLVRAPATPMGSGFFYSLFHCIPLKAV